MQSEPPPPSDRRSAERHLACFPAEVQRADGETRFAMIRDLSLTGALLLVRTELNVGDRVRLDLHLEDEPAPPRDVRGKIVRVEPLSDDEVGLWSRKIGVQFDGTIDMEQKDLDALRERRARLGLR